MSDPIFECGHTVIDHGSRCIACGERAPIGSGGAWIVDSVRGTVRIMRVGPGGILAWIETMDPSEAVMIADHLREVANKALT
jgi:hypothetical protein